MMRCISMSATRYRIFVTVQHCLRNSTKNTKQLCCRELRPCFVPNCSILPVIRNNAFECLPTRTLFTPVLSAIRNDAICYTGRNRFSSKKSKSDDKDDFLDEKDMTLFQKMKYLVKNYWYISIPVHTVTSCVWMGSLYYMSVSGVDLVQLFETLGVPDNWIEKCRNTKATHLITAYTFYKLLTPIRYAITIGGTKLSISFLRKRGWIKPMPFTDVKKRMYQKYKGALKDLILTYKDNLKKKKRELMKTKEEIKQHCIEARDILQKSVIDSKRELKMGAKQASSEWKHVGRLLYKELSQTGKPKADYVAKLVKETEKK